MSKQDIHISIVQTLAFFAVIHHALTKEELKHNLWKIDMCANEVFESILQQLITEKTISKQDEYYGLNTNHLDEAKHRRSLIPNFTAVIEKTTQLFECIPWVEDVYLVNSVSFGAPHEGSDLDLLVVCKDNLIWLTRVWTTFIFWIHGLWRHGDDIEGKVCLSFFITKSHQDLSPIQLDDIDDIYLIYWMLFAKPIFTRGTPDLLDQNQWVFNFVPNAKHNKENNTIRCSSITEKHETTEQCSLPTLPLSIKGAWGIFSSLLNTLLKLILLPRHRQKSHTATSSVIISDTMLKFHENDRRKRFWKEWKKQIQLT